MTAYIVVFGGFAVFAGACTALAAWLTDRDERPLSAEDAATLESWEAMAARKDVPGHDVPRGRPGPGRTVDPGISATPGLVPAARQAGREVTADRDKADRSPDRSEDRASLPRPKAPGPGRAGGPLTVTSFAPVTTAPSGIAPPVKGDSAGPGDHHEEVMPAGTAPIRPLENVSRPGSDIDRLPAASEGPHRAGTRHAAGPGQDAERDTSRSITGPGRRRWLRRNQGPVNFCTTALLRQACETAALLAYAETILAGAS